MLKHTVSFFLSCMVIAGSLLIGGCDVLYSFGVGTTPIKTILENPTAYKDSVVVRGIVGEQINVFGQGVYELKDATGLLWIKTGGDMPEKGSTVSVQGSLDQGLKIGDVTLGISLTEVERFD
jgi:hypothetical protein